MVETLWGLLDFWPLGSYFAVVSNLSDISGLVRNFFGKIKLSCHGEGKYDRVGVVYAEITKC